MNAQTSVKHYEPTGLFFAKTSTELAKCQTKILSMAIADGFRLVNGKLQAPPRILASRVVGSSLYADPNTGQLLRT